MRWNENQEKKEQASLVGIELTDYLVTSLKEGTDYGKLKGYEKPTLLKPGAEKICRYLNLAIEYAVTHRYTDWEMGVFFYEIKVQLRQIDSGVVVAEGIGSCNTQEAFFAESNGFTQLNMVMKMAKKRALVDAALNVSAASGFLTQDIEDHSKEILLKNEDSSVTQKQLAKIHQLVKELQMEPETARNIMKDTFSVEHSTKLAKVQASRFIQELQALKKN